MRGVGGEVRVYPKALQRASTGFEDGSDQLKAIFDRLGSRLSAEGKCWGGDKTGQQFEKDYLPGAQGVQKAGPQLAKTLSEVGKGIDKMAQRYIAAEDSSTVT